MTVDEFYDYEVPGYVRGAGKTFIKISVEDVFGGCSTLKIKMDDVIRYFAFQAHSMSGCRTLAGFTSDWRMVDNLAQECLNYFKFINVEALRRVSKKYKLIPKF